VATVHSSRVRSAADRELLASLTPSMDRLIVPSESIRRKVDREGRHDARFSVIPNGVDPSRFASAARSDVRRELGLPEGAPLVGVVARLEPEKGHRHLLAAWPSVVERHPRARLLVVGDGSLARPLKALATRLGIRDSVVFTGRRDDVAAVTAELAVAVLPSVREAQGISILEAMARRVAVVATDVGGIPEVITSGTDGLLVPPEDPVALARAIARLLSDEPLRRRLAEAGYRTVEERYSLDAQIRRVEAVYDEELARAGVMVPAAASRRGPQERGALEMPPGG
jgi:glycosyltransferase involved in cell wall biosynthesis